jgi:hypothetical protein
VWAPRGEEWSFPTAYARRGAARKEKSYGDFGELRGHRVGKRELLDMHP